MAIQFVAIKKSQTAKPLRIHICDDDGTPVNLTNAGEVRCQIFDGYTGQLISHEPAPILSPTDGLVEYRFTGSEPFTSGDYLMHFMIDTSDGLFFYPSFDYIRLKVIEVLP
ncbi:MAG: hypothetical protein BWY95_02026 [Bacteroidetes bacterium ADurb.BinA104]|nr:MAG: hypothetical protein BWY95_02026 [Bacteroidetes bacterium ADurb.BinA104]